MRGRVFENIRKLAKPARPKYISMCKHGTHVYTDKNIIIVIFSRSKRCISILYIYNLYQKTLTKLIMRFNDEIRSKVNFH